MRLSFDELGIWNPADIEFQVSYESKKKMLLCYSKTGLQSLRPSSLLSRSERIMILTTISLAFAIILLPVSDANTNKADTQRYSSGRIVGGELTDRKYFPYIVSIQKFSKRRSSHGGWYHNCGGSIVSQFWVLTACHCVASTKEKPLKYKDLAALRVVAGVTNLKEYTPERQERGIEMAVAHQKCSRGGHIREYTYYDVGLMKVEHPLQFSSRVHPLNLYSRDKTTAVEELRRLQGLNALCYSPGWGRVQQVPKIVHSSKLKAAIQMLHTASECHDILCSMKHVNDTEGKCSNLNKIEQVCVTSQDASVRNGDSGGPLVCEGFVFGVVSQVGSSCKYGGMQIFSGIRSILNMVNKFVPEGDEYMY